MSPAIHRLVEEARPFYYLLRRHALKPMKASDAEDAEEDDDDESTPGGTDDPSKRRRIEAKHRCRRNVGEKEKEEEGPVTAAADKRQRDKKAGGGGGTHAYTSDPRNADVLIGVRDGVRDVFELTWRPEAKVSVFDAGFVLGDGVWEGIRLHRGVLLFAEEHIRRLYQGAKAIDMDLGCTPAELEAWCIRPWTRTT